MSHIFSTLTCSYGDAVASSYCCGAAAADVVGERGAVAAADLEIRDFSSRPNGCSGNGSTGSMIWKMPTTSWASDTDDS